MSYICKTGKGEEADPSLAIFPILKEVDGKRLVVGSAFFITNTGIFVTAKHVIKDVFDERGKQKYPIFGLQILPDDKYIIRPVLSCYSNTKSDVVVGALEQQRHKITGEPRSNKLLVLTLIEPKQGARIVTYAYPGSKTEIEGNVQTLTLKPEYYDGVLEDYLPEGRDKSMLPFPCYRGSIRIIGGASGGPVMDEQGRVFGINCTGFEGTNISFFARINEILALRVDDLVINGVHRDSIDIIELAERKVIIFEPSFKRSQIIKK
ncbi:MAG: serine protease [Candidatus Omnitrophica bacterium]|jgi:hypothetical protein|nr:serine protease [Candidatus Omnitrophota bacterium]